MMTYLEMSQRVLRRAKEEQRRREQQRKTRRDLAAACAVLLLVGGVLFVARSSASSKPEDTLLSPTQTQIFAAATEEQAPTSSQAGAALLHIPAVRLPEPDLAMEADMIALVVYHGSIYTDAGSFWDAEAEAWLPLLGEQLGTADGRLDEWSDRDSYGREFAGSCAGPVYSVTGYDPDFRLCVCRQVEDAEGKPIWHAQLLERLNDIDLSVGADLFQDRLHLKGRVRSAEYQLHEDWDRAGGNYHSLDVDLTDFLLALDQGAFVDMWQQNRDFYRGSSVHVYLHLEDGTTVALRLIQGGYVLYEPLGWYPVQISPDVFDPVFRAAEGS